GIRELGLGADVAPPGTYAVAGDDRVERPRRSGQGLQPARPRLLPPGAGRPRGGAGGALGALVVSGGHPAQEASARLVATPTERPASIRIARRDRSATGRASPR